MCVELSLVPRSSSPRREFLILSFTPTLMIFSDPLYYNIGHLIIISLILRGLFWLSDAADFDYGLEDTNKVTTIIISAWGNYVSTPVWSSNCDFVPRFSTL
jgi:hypothetical protein